MKQLASVATNQLDKLIRRIASVVVIAVGMETIINASQQVSLEDTFAIIQVVLFTVFTLLAFAGLWFTLGMNVVIFYSTMVLLLIWCAAIEFTNQSFDQEIRPWIWWAIGLSAILAAVFANRIFASIYLPAVAVSWFVVELAIFGQQRFLQAILDSAYFVIFALAILGLVGVVRQSAENVDLANTEAIQSSIERAKQEAIEKESQRLDALIHDQVLHTLLLAARAETESEVLSARRSALRAIESLEEGLSEQNKLGPVTSSGLLAAIANAAKNLDPRIEVNVHIEKSFEIPSDAALAITEATMQALDNAVQHSSAKLIELSMNAESDSKLFFSIEDDGVGFRINRVPQNRIGINTSIKFRMESVNGTGEIVSSPGNGTRVRLEWRK